MTRRAKRSVAGQILGYLIEHRSAQDTLEGIAGWWIPQQRLKCELEHAKSALDELVAKDFLVAHELADGRTHYRVNPSKEHEICEFLEEDRGAYAEIWRCFQANPRGGPKRDAKRLGQRESL